MANYPQRFQHVLDYIETHLSEPLTVERLSEIANLSRYHFHRQFSALYGMTLLAYVTATRMKRASCQLAYRRQMRVIDIAFDNGYESSEAFSRVFSQYFGQTPSGFRREPQWRQWHRALQQFQQLGRAIMPTELSVESVDIVDFPGMKLAVYEHRGAPESLGDSIRQFIAWRRKIGLHPDISRTFNILYDDPDNTPPASYRFGLGAEVKSPVRENSYGIVNSSIDAGRCAHLRLTGPDHLLEPAIQWLYREWLPASGVELRDAPLFLERVRFYPEVPERQAVTDVFLPLK